MKSQFYCISEEDEEGVGGKTSENKQTNFSKHVYKRARNKMNVIKMLGDEMVHSTHKNYVCVCVSSVPLSSTNQTTRNSTSTLS